MAKLQNALAKKIPVWRNEIRNLVKKKGAKKMSDVSVLQAYGGMRGVKAMICDTSEVPPDVGPEASLPQEDLRHFLGVHLSDVVRVHDHRDLAHVFGRRAEQHGDEHRECRKEPHVRRSPRSTL